MSAKGMGGRRRRWELRLRLNPANTALRRLDHLCVWDVLLQSLPLILSYPFLHRGFLSFDMATPHVIASSSGHPSSHSGTSSGIVGAHFRVGKKIGEGSFGVVFEGTCSLFLFWATSSRDSAFVLEKRYQYPEQSTCCNQVCESDLCQQLMLQYKTTLSRNRESLRHHSSGMSIGRTEH